MTRGEIIAWLHGLTCTAPFTLADAKELWQLVHGLKPGGLIVDVYTTRGDKVFVRIDDMTKHPPIEVALDVV